MKTLEEKQAELAKLDSQNQNIYNQLRRETNNQFSMDTVSTRQEMLLDFLVSSEIMSEEQRVDFELQFHTEVNSAMRNFQSELTKAKIATPKPSKLIVPGR